MSGTPERNRFSMQNSDPEGSLKLWCRRPDLNRHEGLPHTILSRARLPIPPLRRRLPYYNGSTVVDQLLKSRERVSC